MRIRIFFCFEKEYNINVVTIYDLAKITGFSAPTVSKALNGTGKLSEETRQKILEAAKQANYNANMAARALTTKRTKLIGIILEDVTQMGGFEHPLFGGVLNRFRSEMDIAGYDIIFLSKALNKTMNYTDHCNYRNVEGVLIMNPPPGDEEIKNFADSGIPCVSTNEIIKGVCSIVTENTEAGKQACSEFIKAGHKRIGFIGPEFTEASPASLERHNGYKAALEEAGIEYDESLVEICDYWDSESGYKAAKILFERCPDVTAIFAANDTVAFGIMRAAYELGKKMPEDISLIGFDDDRMSRFANPALSTFKQDRERIAELAAECLLQSIAGIPKPEIVRVPAEFVSRDSVCKIN